MPEEEEADRLGGGADLEVDYSDDFHLSTRSASRFFAIRTLCPSIRHCNHGRSSRREGARNGGSQATGRSRT